jgi:hypothetical protein
MTAVDLRGKFVVADDYFVADTSTSLSSDLNFLRTPEAKVEPFSSFFG